MAETAAATASDSSSEPKGGTGGGADARADRAHTARMLVVIGALAAGFAIVPRVTQSCDKASGTQDAADFTAAVLANPAEPSQTSMTMSALRGHPVVLDFWATWCPPCQAEAPIVNGIAQRFKDKGLVVIGVNTADPDGPRLAPAFAKKKGLTFPILFDEGNTIAQKYDAGNLPTLVFVSKEGKIVARREGITSESELERIIRQIL
jgi:thiol-disulfide isomerase/thioredoxin